MLGYSPMTDDQALRIVLGGAIIAAVGVLRGPIMRWLYRIGYRDWRDPQRDKPPPE